MIASPRRTRELLLFGSLGSGTLAHLELDLLQSVAKVKFTHVPYKGSAPAKTDLTAGHIQLLFDSVASSGGLIQAGKLRPIAMASSARSGSLPEVPTFIESGLKDFQANNWYGLLAPAGTPKGAVDRLGTELPKILALPDVKRRFSGRRVWM